MDLLLDTQLLVWLADDSSRLSERARLLVRDPGNMVAFSAASLWEIAIKSALRRDDFRIEPRSFRRDLLGHGYTELPVTGLHAVAIDTLPPLHKDPFDRLLLAQAMTEGITLLTTDARLGRYQGPVRVV